MKKSVLIGFMIVLAGLFFGALSVAMAAGDMSDCELTSYPARPANFGEVDIPPLGAKVDIVNNGNGTRMVTFSGFTAIYDNKVEIYGGKKIYVCPLKNGSRTYPGGMWLNTMFKADDPNYHFILVADEYQTARQIWMGNGTCVMPSYGRGSALIYCGDLRKEYR